jgi:hypothetical protein
MSTLYGHFRVGAWLDTVTRRPIYVIEMYHEGRWRPCTSGTRPHVYELQYDACGMMQILEERRHARP